MGGGSLNPEEVWRRFISVPWVSLNLDWLGFGQVLRHLTQSKTPQTCLGNCVVPGNLCEVKMCKLVNLYTSTEDMKIFCEIHSEATIVCTASFLCL